MSTKLKRFLITMLILVMSISIFVMPAQADTPDETVTIPVNLKLIGHLPDTPETFQICVEAENPNYPLPEGAEEGKYILSVSAPLNEDGTAGDTGTGNIVINYKNLGVYTYTIRQLPNANEDCYADGKAYFMTVYVTNSADYTSFETSVAIYRLDNDGNKVGEKCEIEFGNRYAKPVEVPLTAIKTLNSKTPKDGQFTFILKDEDGEEVERVTNMGQSVTFTPIVFDKAGTYTYKISEVKGKDSKIIYDSSVYTVTIEVSKDENLDYQAEVSYEKGLKDYEGTPKFANKTKSSSPQTGDMFRMGLWIGLLAVSGVALVILVVMYFKKRKK